MKEMLIVVWCDTCASVNEKVEATQARVFEDTMLDLCEGHSREVDKAIEGLREVFSAGVSVESEKVKPRKREASTAEGDEFRRTCQEPGCGWVSVSRAGLGQHVKHKHSKRLGDYDWEPSGA